MPQARAVGPSAVALFIVYPLKGMPVAGGWDPKLLGAALLLNGAWGLGLALLMRSGIAGWMQSWAPCVVEAVAPLKERLGNDAIFPFEMRREVTIASLRPAPRFTYATPT